ncbi:MAG: alanine dehydrogenase, partial [Bacteroidota bacterium]
MEKLGSDIAEIVRETALAPQESPLKIKKESKSVVVSVPKATRFQESRVALKPDSVGVLVNNGLEVHVEAGAGKLANFKDEDYSEAGAKIVYDRKELFQGHMILKVAPPSLEEIEMMSPGAVLISAFQTGKQSINYLQALAKRRITAIGYEFIEDKVGGLPLVRAMSEIAGSSVMLIAAEYLSSTQSGRGIILGGITGVPPTRVVILGAGTVAEYAARAGLGLGADIQVFDNHIYKLRRLKHAVGRQVHTGTLYHATLDKALLEADVLIGAIRAEKGINLQVVSEEMVSRMKPGSVIVDVSIDQGGCV